MVSTRRSSIGKDRGLDVVDATCPHVSKAHDAAGELRADGYAVVIVGEADHPEVEGIMAHAGGEAVVVEDVGQLPDMLPSRRVGVVVQTTQSESLLEAVVAALVPRVTELRVYNTICSATVKRQRSAAELAESVDVARRGGPQLRQHHAAGGDLPRDQPAHLPCGDSGRARSQVVRGRDECGRCGWGVNA